MNILLLWEALTFASAIFESVRNELDRFNCIYLACIHRDKFLFDECILLSCKENF